VRFIRSIFVSVGLGAALFVSSVLAFGQSEWLIHSFAANGSQGTEPYGI